MTDPAKRTPAPRLALALRAGLFVVAGGHALACALWMWLSPGGFPLLHARTFTGAWLPLVLGGFCVIGAGAALMRREKFATAALACCLGAWIAGAATGAVLYDAGRLRLLAGAAVPLVTLLLGAAAVRLLAPAWTGRGALLLAVVGLAIGAAFPWLVRAPTSSTRPTGEPAPLPSSRRPVPNVLPIGDTVSIVARARRVDWKGRWPAITVMPWLSFESRAPDRGWTLFTRARVRSADGIGAAHVASRSPGVIAVETEGLLRRTLDVALAADGATLDLDARTTLDAPEYAHLAPAAEIRIATHQTLTATFDAAPDVPIEIRPSDYPFGRPARFAALHADGVLRVHEATSGEKGPFTTLAEGALARDAALTITLADGDGPVLAIRLDDFASQASTALSPTAGWGVPQNRIVLDALEDSSGDQGAVVLRVSWADTAIGRGFDTVGHAAGTYRNRITLKRLR